MQDEDGDEGSVVRCGIGKVFVVEVDETVDLMAMHNRRAYHT